MDWIVGYSRPAQPPVVCLPPSKSLAARALMLGAKVSCGSSPCDDLFYLRQAIGKSEGNVDVGSSGTALRFLTARYAAQQGCHVRLSGTAQLRTRPVGPLVDTLRAMGARIRYDSAEGFAPLLIEGCPLTSEKVFLDASMSSQFLSALLLAAPLVAGGVVIEAPRVTSLPYVRMTLAVMKRFGMECGESGPIFRASGKPVVPPGFEPEADWSAASFFLELQALTRSRILMPGLDPPSRSLQGDAGAQVLFGRLSTACFLETDMSGMPDVVPALAVASALMGVCFRFAGVGTLRIKECDRIAAITDGLRRLGYVLRVEGDSLVWKGECTSSPGSPVISSFGDHRIAMAFAPAAAVRPLVIRGAECVAKSFPDYATQMGRCGLIIKTVC